RLDGIEMGAHEGRVLVAERHVDRRAQRPHLLRRWDQGRPFAERGAHRRAHLRMQQSGGMFELAPLADDRSLAEALGLRPLYAERREAMAGQEIAEFRADLDERREIGDVT